MKNSNWVLGLDFETTGLEVAKDDIDVITEVGAVLWDWSTRRPICIYSDTVEITPGRVLDDDVVALTGITQDMVTAPIAKPEAEVLANLIRLMSMAGAYMAHNAPFDKACLDAAVERNFMEYPPGVWVDSALDVPFPTSTTSRKLGHLAADHGFVNPFAHRAVFDVLTMFKMTEGYPLPDVLAIATSPTITLLGTFQKDQNEAAKRVGFRWNPDIGRWFRTIKQAQFDRVKHLINLPYTVETT